MSVKVNVALAENENVTGFSFEVADDTLAVMLNDLDAIPELEDELGGWEFEDGAISEEFENELPAGTEVVAYYKKQ